MSPRRILIIDDEPRIRTLFRRQLKNEGYSAVEADDGERALDLLGQDNEIDLVVLDISLPKTSGMDTFAEIRKRFPWIKILVSSVYSQDEQGFLIGEAEDYYYKSDSLSLLTDKIGRLLDA
jgi:two-component system, OmpR family, response regulator ResD